MYRVIHGPEAAGLRRISYDYMRNSAMWFVVPLEVGDFAEVVDFALRAEEGVEQDIDG
jgi:hypothetical protein